MKALLIKSLDEVKAECDIVLMFEDSKPCEVNFMRRGNSLFVFVDGANEHMKIRLREQ